MAELRLWLSLLKLRVVVLLQVTAIAAILAHDLTDRQLLRTMVLGNDPRSWADTLETALVVLLGGSMASGGSMAINMWYDRDIDPLMARTDQRPLPSGELAPGAVLAYGVTVCAAGVALLAQFATPLAGAIAGFSALFYVLVYTVWLKRRTPQNIVIGGLAGALSPLVGWTATGGDPLALLPWGMVAIIFLWTPPHFWALTLARPGEYARAGVPMLPVTAGEAATRRHITAYAVALLLASLAYTSIFLLINALVQRPLPVSLVYWLVWEVMLASGDSQRFSVMHYLRSFALPQLKYFGIEAGDLGLTAESLGGEFATMVSIATDPGQAVAVLLAVTALAFMLASRLLERKQF